MRFEGEAASPTPILPISTGSFSSTPAGDTKTLWQPLPRDLAAFVAAAEPAARREPRRICMITHSFFLPMPASRATLRASLSGVITLMCWLCGVSRCSAKETLGNIDLFRLQPRYGKTEKSRLSHLLPSCAFS